MRERINRPPYSYDPLAESPPYEGAQERRAAAGLCSGLRASSGVNPLRDRQGKEVEEGTWEIRREKGGGGGGR